MKQKLFLALLSFLLVPLGMMAQNVTLSANNGNTIASMKNGGVEDTFYSLGGFATWQHEQLNMMLTVADDTQLTENGQLANPANNLFKNGSKIQIAHGQVSNADVCYATLSLPRGYRFTGYTIHFTKPRDPQGNRAFNTGNAGSESSTFGETDITFGNWITSASISINGAEQVIERTEMNEGDMGNVLHFKLQNPSRTRALIQLEYAEFFFTAEENYTPVLPIGDFDAVSAVDIPFATSKVDFGTIESRSYNNSRRISYSSANVHDLEGDLHLYEAESTTGGNGIDGLSGEVVDYKEGTISSKGGYFQLGRADEEQVYFIESPDNVKLGDANGTRIPVGYRITQADFEYINNISETVHYITYTANGTKYYLNAEGAFSATPTEWEEDEGGRLHSYANGDDTYLGFTVGGSALNRTYTFAIYRDSRPDHPLYVNSDNRIYGTYQGTFGNTTVYLKYNSGNAQVATGNNGNLTSWETGYNEYDNNFTLYIYDKTGENPEEIVVNSENPIGTYTLKGLNNDAVKFGVKGVGFVRATLTMQALDPYLDNMTVVCQDENQTKIRTTQTFTASDFSVSGGEFYFYVPEDLHGDNVKITFEELKSKYFDESYEGGSADHNARISFVKSDHYNAFGSESNNNVYSNLDEAANAEEERLKVGIVGTKKFRFNNADEVGTNGGYYMEFPFSLENYQAGGGSFDEMTFTVSEEDQVLTRYVFTTDETRYNIAPTTATQHRAYAFYEMIVHVQTGTYEPKFAFTKIYDKTFSNPDKDDAYYGVTVTCEDQTGKPGYCSTQAIRNGLAKILTVTKVDDFGNTDIPEKATQILYLDFSQLAGIYQVSSTDETEQQTIENMIQLLAKNCLIFVPEGTSAAVDNVAYKTGGGDFVAANNVVLTDKEPFYSPFDISFAGMANKVTYKREITIDKYGKVQNASLILPFVVTVDENGIHQNPDGTSFSLHTMQSENALALIDGSTYAYFPPLSNVSATEANKPYMVHLDENSTEDNISFVVEQPGSTIFATTGMEEDYSLIGETSTGLDVAEGGLGQPAGLYAFTPHGTYAGQQIPKAAGVFYFAKNKFVSSLDYIYDDDIYVYPFRVYYNTISSNGSNSLSAFDIIFGEGVGNITDGIGTVKEGQPVYDYNAPVYDLQGRKVAESLRGVAAQKGMYVINGMKVVIK